MARVFLVRHGQSAGQFEGEAVGLPDQIPLTDVGREQAVDFANSVTEAPDLIVASPFVRAQETAAPLRARFGFVPFETWAVQEFTFLDPESCVGTTRESRGPRRRAYFEKNDPEYRDGSGAESFSDFVGRARCLLSRCRGFGSDVRLVYVFTHCFFMRLVLLLIEYPSDDDKSLMARFYSGLSDMAIENCAVVEVQHRARFVV
jgi:broad specificity phosphatase PhoE